MAIQLSLCMKVPSTFFTLVLIITASDAFVNPKIPLSVANRPQVSASVSRYFPPASRTKLSTILVTEEQLVARQGGDGSNNGNWNGNNGGGDDEDDEDYRPQCQENPFHLKDDDMLYTFSSQFSTLSTASTSWATIDGTTSFNIISWLPLVIVKIISKVKSLNYSSCLNWYLTKLETQPLVTKSVTSAMLGFIGDAGAQYFERVLKRYKKSTDHAVPNYSLRRGIAVAIDGLLISGPIMHFGYDFFEKLLPVASGAGATPYSRSLAALAHVIADSIILDSIFVATAMVSSGILEGYSFHKDIIPQMKRDYVGAWRASVFTSSLMSPLEFLAFRVLPVNLRVLAVDLMDIIWDAVVSFNTHKGRSAVEGGEWCEELRPLGV